jgi:hypothetical protein
MPIPGELEQIGLSSHEVGDRWRKKVEPFVIATVVEVADDHVSLSWPGLLGPLVVHVDSIDNEWERVSTVR